MLNLSASVDNSMAPGGADASDGSRRDGVVRKATMASASARASLMLPPMTFKRRVLSALGKADLLEIGRGLELEVTTRMSVDELRDVLARSKRASMASIVSSSL